MNAIDLLITQHRALESRFEDLMAAADGGSPARCKTLLAEVGDDLAVHIASEELAFYPAVKARRTEDILMESLEEHLSLKRLLSDLLALSPTEDTFKPKAKVLQEQTEHHHEEEEENLFPKVRQLLDERELDHLGEAMLLLQQKLRSDGDPRAIALAERHEATPLL
jgi:hemerythrin superfamily protein